MKSPYGARGLAAVLTVVLTAGCASPTSDDADVSVDGAPSETVGSAGHDDAAPSSDPSTEVAAESRPFDLYTHCGVESALIDGVWWHAEPPLYDERRSGPPAGWGDPYQAGTLTVLSDDRAVFEARGAEVVFVPAPDDEPVRICD